MIFHFTRYKINEFIACYNRLTQNQPPYYENGSHDSYKPCIRCLFGFSSFKVDRREEQMRTELSSGLLCALIV